MLDAPESMSFAVARSVDRRYPGYWRRGCSEPNKKLRLAFLIFVLGIDPQGVTTIANGRVQWGAHSIVG
jgi:hypothetical protein